MKVLLFGGTSEGRAIVHWLAERECAVTVCVATEYGASFVPVYRNVKAIIGRLDCDGMVKLMQSHQYDCVVDATHPYAIMVTDTIGKAAKTAKLKVYRVVRDGGKQGKWSLAQDVVAAAKLASEMSGNILLTTGSKDLDVYARWGLASRCYPRVLPTVESLNRCVEYGYPIGNILCMQGKFTKELNIALIHQYQIDVMITKDSGTVGGFNEKVEAAKEAGCQLIVIGRVHEEEGLSLESLFAKLQLEMESKV